MTAEIKLPLYPMEIRCAWCPGQPIIRMEMAEGPGRVSHGICPTHFQQLVEECRAIQEMNRRH